MKTSNISTSLTMTAQGQGDVKRHCIQLIALMSLAALSIGCVTRAEGVTFNGSLASDSVRGDFHGRLNTSFADPADTASGTSVAEIFGDEVAGDRVTINLGLLSEAPRELYAYGGIGLELGDFSEGPIWAIGGGGGGIFLPGQARPANSELRVQSYAPLLDSRMNLVGSVHYDIGFLLPFQWDGREGIGKGEWWVRYDIRDVPKGVPDSGLNSAGLLGIALALIIALQRIVEGMKISSPPTSVRL